MPRTVKEFTLMQSPESLFAAMHQFLTSKGYKYCQFEGELVFKKGVGFWVAPRFIKVTFAPGCARLEGWIKMAALPGVYYGESDLEGFVGVAAKSPAKADLAQLEAMVIQAGGYPSHMVPQPVVPPVNTTPAPALYCTNCGTARTPGVEVCAGCGQTLT